MHIDTYRDRPRELPQLNITFGFTENGPFSIIFFENGILYILLRDSVSETFPFQCYITSRPLCLKCR